MREDEQNDGHARRPGGLRRALARATALAPVGLLARVRWLFLLFALLAGATTLIAVANAPLAPPERLTAVVSLAVWTAWLLHRHRHPDVAVATDVIGPIAIVALGLVMRDVALINGVAYVSLFFRVLYGDRRQAVANGLLHFASVHLPMLAASGPETPPVVQIAVNLVSFVAVALVIHALGDVAGQHEAAARRERVLTAVSARLLQARTPQQVHQAAADATLELAGVPDASASVWSAADGLELVASAGPDVFDLRRVPMSAAPSTRLARFLEGTPYLLDAEETRDTERTYGLPHRFEAMLIGPLVRDGRIAGALILTSPRPLDTHLLDVMERFLNEITLAAERAKLLGDLEAANTELRYADEMKDQFLSTVSHELRTPLTSIHGFAQTLRRRGVALSDEERDRFLEIIERQSLRQQRLVEDLLVTSRMTAGRLTTDPEDVDVGAALLQVVEELGIDADELELRCPRPAVAHVDPMHLHQILVNLLTNAQKYGEPPYVVEVDPTSETCRITIHDHGPGIPPDFRARLFERFAQADAGDRRTSKGTGLGLAIIRSLVVANAGSIGYLPDRPGACFEIVLPTGAAPRAASRSAGADRSG